MSIDVVLIALGGNAGEPRARLLDASDRLERQFGGRGWRMSSLWLTEPVGCPPGSPDFVNAVVAFPLDRLTPDMTPALLLAWFQQLEREAGRRRSEVRNAPRALDLDLLLYGALRLADKHCTLPHPRALGRRFVLEPAAEVVPDLVWPGTDRTVREHCLALRGDPDQSGIRRLDG